MHLKMRFLTLENILLAQVVTLTQPVLDFFSRQKSDGYSGQWTSSNGVKFQIAGQLALEGTINLPNFVVPVETANVDSEKVSYRRQSTVGTKSFSSLEAPNLSRDRIVIAVNELNAEIDRELAALKAAEATLIDEKTTWSTTSGGGSSK